MRLHVRFCLTTVALLALAMLAACSQDTEVVSGAPSVPEGEAMPPASESEAMPPVSDGDTAPSEVDGDAVPSGGTIVVSEPAHPGSTFEATMIAPGDVDTGAWYRLNVVGSPRQAWILGPETDEQPPTVQSLDGDGAGYPLSASIGTPGEPDRVIIDTLLLPGDVEPGTELRICETAENVCGEFVVAEP